MSAIRVSGLCLHRPAGFTLGPLDVEFPAGAKVAVVGASGCGKTTLLRCIAGLEVPDAGTIAFGDRVVQDARTSVAAGARRIGFVFQDAALWPHLDAVQHLQFVDPRLSRAAALAMLEQVGLAACAARRPAAMSGGEAQRLALARALAGDPQALLLDEPLNAVDAPLRDELSLLVHRLCDARGLTLIAVTHDRVEALAMADHLLVLRAGQVVESGPAARVLRTPRTAYAAAIVGDAACLPVTRRGDGAVDTPLGRFPAAAARNGAERLVLLPGDLVVTGGTAAEGSTADGAAARGRVLRVVPAVDGVMAMVEIGGHVVRVSCPPDTAPGVDLPLALRAAPRILPVGGPQ